MFCIPAWHMTVFTLRYTCIYDRHFIPTISTNKHCKVQLDVVIEVSYACNLDGALSLYDVFGRRCQPSVKNGASQKRILLFNR